MRYKGPHSQVSRDKKSISKWSKQACSTRRCTSIYTNRKLEKEYSHHKKWALMTSLGVEPRISWLYSAMIPGSTPGMQWTYRSQTPCHWATKPILVIVEVRMVYHPTWIEDKSRICRIGKFVCVAKIAETLDVSRPHITGKQIRRNSFNESSEQIRKCQIKKAEQGPPKISKYINRESHRQTLLG